MNDHAMLEDKAMIEKLLARMRAKEPGIPADKVKTFLADVGKEIERAGCLSKDYVDQLLRKLNDGER
jgi:hypothetical protein